MSCSPTLLRPFYSFFISMMGSMFIISVNGALPQPRQQSIDSRSVQWHSKVFFQNLAMLWVVGSYTFAAAYKIGPVLAMLMLGILVFGATFLVSLYLIDNK